MTRPALAAALLGVAVLVVRTSCAGRLRRLTRSRSGRRPWQRLTPLCRRHGRPALASVAVTAVTAALWPLPTSLALAVPLGLLTFALARILARAGGGRDPTGTHGLRIAMTADLLAACLTAGLAVPVAVRAVADTAPTSVSNALRATADLLALGAEPAQAWEPARRLPQTAELARAAVRTARSGSALSGAATALAQRARATVSDEAEAKAQRAGVLITAPLGLCFLPAFLCLGVLPVVIGLATQLTGIA